MISARGVWSVVISLPFLATTVGGRDISSRGAPYTICPGPWYSSPSVPPKVAGHERLELVPTWSFGALPVDRAACLKDPIGGEPGRRPSDRCSQAAISKTSGAKQRHRRSSVEADSGASRRRIARRARQGRALTSGSKARYCRPGTQCVRPASSADSASAAT